MSRIQVESWAHLLEVLYADSWDEDLARFRSPYIFRGLSDANYSLRTSLTRLGGAYAGMENHLLRNFRKYAHRNIVERDTFWHWLSLGQHHGLPTRLLDWTLSPLVAAHFATANPDRFDRDGAIWMVNHRKTHEVLPDKLRTELDRERSDFFTVDMLARAVPGLAELDTLSPPEFVIFFEPPSIDERITNQYALFSVMPSTGSCLSDWLAQNPDLFHLIILPARLKWEVRDKLDQANITERVLFPGLDGLSQWQRRYYTPKKYPE